MADLEINSGYALTAGQKNVDAPQLNNLVRQATIQPGFVSLKDAIDAAAGASGDYGVDQAADQLLLYDAGAGELKRVSVQSLVSKSDNLIANQSALAVPVGADSVAISDASETAGSRNKRVTLSTLITGAADIGADIDETNDKILLYDNSAGDIRSAAFSRLQTYVDTRLFAVPKNWGVLVKSVSPYEVDIDASARGGAIVAVNGAGIAKLVQFTASASISVIDGTTTGLNALDTGTLATGWYYVWFAYNATSATYGGLLSLQTDWVSVTRPASYDYGALVGAVYYDQALPSFWPTWGRGSYFAIKEVAVLTGVTVAASHDLVTTELAAFRTAVPPIATAAFGTIGTTANDGAPVSAVNTKIQVGSAMAPNVGGGTVIVGAQTVVMGTACGATYNTFGAAAPFVVPLVQHNMALNGTGTINLRLTIVGFSLDL